MYNKCSADALSDKLKQNKLNPFHNEFVSVSYFTHGWFGPTHFHVIDEKESFYHVEERIGELIQSTLKSQPSDTWWE